MLTSNIYKYVRRILTLSLILVILFTSFDASAQRKRKGYLKRRNKAISHYKGGSIHFDKSKRYVSVGFSVDALNYFGDITPKSSFASTDISFTRPGVGLYLAYRYRPNLTLRGSLSYGRIQGDDFKSADPYGENSKFRYVRNLSFRNDITELAVGGVWDFMGNHGTFLNRVDFTPYVWGGVAAFHHNPMGKAPELDKNGQPLAEADTWVALRPLGTEGQYSDAYNIKPYSNFQVSIPFGIGIRKRIEKRWDFEFEVGYRYLFTDYIDDVSGMYADLGALNSDLAKAMSDRSRETTAAVSGKERDFDAINAVSRPVTYTSKYDGQQYTVLAGYGEEFPTNNRGLSKDKDIYIVTSFRISYILTGSFRRAKFR